MGLRIETEQNDENARWMWKLMDGDRFICISDIHGFETEQKAREGAKRALSLSVEVDGDYGPEYAGERDFSD